MKNLNLSLILKDGESVYDDSAVMRGSLELAEMFDIESLDMNVYERGLTHDNITIRMRWASFRSVIPSKDQYERGLKDPHYIVRLAWALRDDIQPTKEQFEAGCNDTDQIVSETWRSRYES